jgi:leucyl/phenylalanyl-tRNA--protein transferase
MSTDHFSDDLPDLFLAAYRHGFFPMADHALDPEFYWVKPQKRGIIPIANLHIPHRLLRTIRQNPFKIRVNTRFQDVISMCANFYEERGRKNTWINTPIKDTFIKLHEKGYAYSVECFLEDRLVGGLYGLVIGDIFCGESMFSIEKDASKIALVYLVSILFEKKFSILDAQFMNDHLRQFGAYEMPESVYEQCLIFSGQKDLIFFDEKMSEDEYIQDMFKTFLIQKEA